MWGEPQHNWPKAGAHFDTTAIDEAQDFRRARIGMLETPLDPDGRRRMLTVADQDQGIYGRMFGSTVDGLVQAELRGNFCNAAPIALILRRRLDGVVPPALVLEESGVSFRLATDLEGVVAAVDGEFERITDKDFRDRRHLCVATFR